MAAHPHEHTWTPLGLSAELGWTSRKTHCLLLSEAWGWRRTNCLTLGTGSVITSRMLIKIILIIIIIRRNVIYIRPKLMVGKKIKIFKKRVFLLYLSTELLIMIHKWDYIWFRWEIDEYIISYVNPKINSKILPGSSYPNESVIDYMAKNLPRPVRVKFSYDAIQAPFGHLKPCVPTGSTISSSEDGIAPSSPSLTHVSIHF